MPAERLIEPAPFSQVGSAGVYYSLGPFSYSLNNCLALQRGLPREAVLHAPFLFLLRTASQPGKYSAVVRNGMVVGAK